ncbi:MAG: hypothetical protein WC350_04245 [Candidatus Micrarchaeia archaeon]|jgi:hypothetical protein
MHDSKKTEMVLDVTVPYLANIVKARLLAVFYDDFCNFTNDNYLGIGTQTIEQTSNDIKNEKTKKFGTFLLKAIDAKISGINNKSVIHNWCLVFYVTSLEVFLKDLFIGIVNNDSEIKKRLIESESKKKIDLISVESYANKKITFGELIAQDYNFQNLDSANAAYRSVGIDLYKIINKELVINGEKINRIKVISDILKMRHKIIHESFNYDKLDRRSTEIYFTILNNLGFDMLRHCAGRKDISSD